MKVYSRERIAVELGCSTAAIDRLIDDYPTFPARKISANVYEFNVDHCKTWCKENHHPTAYKERMKSKEVMIINDFAKELGISRQLVQYWIRKGLASQKLLDNSTIIHIETARMWFLNQNHPRTRAYANKLPWKASDD